MLYNIVQVPLLHLFLKDGLSDGLTTGGHPLSYGGPPGGGPGGAGHILVWWKPIMSSKLKTS